MSTLLFIPLIFSSSLFHFILRMFIQQKEKFKREFRRRFPLFRLRFEHTDVSEKNVSMYTRASSIRSNYTTTSTKTKFMIPQRIVGGNDSLQHYNTLHIADTAGIKNNNVMNGNHNWSVKSSWQSAYNPTQTVVANGTVVEWQDKKCVCFSKIYCKGNDHPSCTTTTMTKATTIPLTVQNNKNNTLLEPLTNNQVKTASIYSHDTTKNCSCCQGHKTICKENIFDAELCCMPKTTAEWEQVNLCKAECSAMVANNKFKCDERDEDIDDNDGDTDNVDFRNEIIRINNIYNNCNANANNTNADVTLPSDTFHLHGFNHSSSKYKNDINL